MNAKAISLAAVCAVAGASASPQEMKDLWAKAHLVIMRWEEFLEHPHDEHLRAKVGERMRDLKAAARTAQHIMEHKA